MNGVPHTKHTVPALHEWHMQKGPHNVVSQWRKGSEPKVADGVQIRRMDIQMDPLISKTVWPDFYLASILQEVPVGERSMKRDSVRNQLDGTKVAFLCFMNRWNDSKGLRIRLAAVVPATKVIVHNNLNISGYGNPSHIVDYVITSWRKIYEYTKE